jgi:hypothetical protein
MRNGCFGSGVGLATVVARLRGARVERTVWPSKRRLSLWAGTLAFATGVLGSVWAAQAGAYVYWTDYDKNTIVRAKLNGHEVNRRFVIGTKGPENVSVGATHVYWYNNSGNTIGRAKLDGTEANQSLVTGAFAFGVHVDAEHIYWSDYETKWIGRAKLDGTEVKRQCIKAAEVARGLAADAEHVYWANYDGSIGRANLDGTEVNQDFITVPTANFLYDVSVDAGHIYWTNYQGTSIGRAKLDGTEVEQSFIGGASYPTNIAVDAGHIYWLNFYEEGIGRANLSGGEVNQSFIIDKTPNADGLAVDANEATALCNANSGTVTLSPGLTNTPAVQTMKIMGKLTGCSGSAYTQVAYKATLKTAGPVSCSVLAGAGETATGTAKYSWSPKASASTGPLNMLLTETPGVSFLGEVVAGSYSPVTLSGTSSESYTGGPTCGVPVGTKPAKAVKKGTYSGSAVSFE